MRKTEAQEIVITAIKQALPAGPESRLRPHVTLEQAGLTSSVELTFFVRLVSQVVEEMGYDALDPAEITWDLGTRLGEIISYFSTLPGDPDTDPKP